jgi:hypothetical protein
MRKREAVPGAPPGPSLRKNGAIRKLVPHAPVPVRSLMTVLILLCILPIFQSDQLCLPTKLARYALSASGLLDL